MAEKKTKTVKKITEIPEAEVKIEVEQKEEVAADEVVEEVKEKESEEVEEASEKISEIPEEPVVENFDESENSFGWKKVFFFTFLAAVIGFAIVAGVLYLHQNYTVEVTKKSEAKNIEITTPAPTPTKAEVDKEAYEIKVLNGSGTPGEAAKVQTLLEDAGFKVGDIGNADTQDFTKTQISAGKDVSQDYIDELEKTLKERGPVEVVKAPSNQTEDVVVTVGSSVDETPTPTP